MMSAVPKEERVDPDFLYYLLRAVDFNEIADGSALPYLTAGSLNKIPVCLPDRSSQEGIAATLGALDDKIELNRRMSATLEEMAGALYRCWFVDFDPVHARAAGQPPAHMAPATAALFPDSFGEDGLPEGWRETKIGHLCEIKGGKQLTKDRFANDGEYPVFGGAGRMGTTNEFNADGFVITIGCVGAYCGKFVAHRGKAWVNNNASLIREVVGVPPEFLFLTLQSLDLSSIKKGAAQPFISNGDLKELSGIVPSDAVLAAFNGRAEATQRRLEALQIESRTLATLRDTLLPRLMSGELRIREAEKDVEKVLT